MNLFTIMCVKAIDLEVCFSRATRYSAEEALVLLNSGALHLIGAKHHGQLEFVFCKNSINHTSVIWPKLIDDYFVIGWEGCAKCEKFKRFIPEMNSITLTTGGSGPVELTIKKMIYAAKFTPDDFPFAMAKDGQTVIPYDRLQDFYGINLEEQ